MAKVIINYRGMSYQAYTDASVKETSRSIYQVCLREKRIIRFSQSDQGQIILGSQAAQESIFTVEEDE